MAKLQRCTWRDPVIGRCERIACHAQVSADGEVWANLCDAHKTELESAYPTTTAFSPGNMLRSWVRAGGGAEVMAARTMRDIGNGKSKETR